MLGKIVGAVVGGSIAKNTKGMAGPTGALVGAAVPFVLRRMSIPAMIALGVGGYVAKKYFDKKDLPKPTDKKSAPVANIPQPETRPNGSAAIASQPVPAGTA